VGAQGPAPPRPSPPHPHPRVGPHGRALAPPGAGRRAVAASAMAARECAEAGRPALYFCGSIRGGREDLALYARIVSRLRRFGAVLTEHVAAAELGARGEAAGRGLRGEWEGPAPALPARRARAPGCRPSGRGFPSTTGEETAGGDRLIHERDLAWLQQADVVVAEVTQPSLGVGYELGRAVALNKQILCLFRPQSGRVLSAMIRGAADGTQFQVWDYEESEVEAALDRYFEAHPSQQVAASPDPTDLRLD
ncbi:2'-deoxynucleoside 5'-phosphate N-hydrolase 1, partial [Galemys pyrenaicus]